MPVLPGSIIWHQSQGWECNHRSGVTLPMYHRQLVYPPIGSRCKEGRWAPHLHFLGVWYTLPYLKVEAAAVSLAVWGGGWFHISGSTVSTWIWYCVFVNEQKDVFMQLLIHAAMKSSNHHHHIMARLYRVFILFSCWEITYMLPLFISLLIFVTMNHCLFYK